MSGELEIRPPPGSGSSLKSPIPLKPVLKVSGVGGEDVSMRHDDGDETEDEVHRPDGRLRTDSKRAPRVPRGSQAPGGLTPNGRTGSVVRTVVDSAAGTGDPSRGLATPSSTLAPLARGGDPSMAASNSSSQWKTPPPLAGRRSPPGSGPSEEAAALLLNFSAIGDHAPVVPIAEEPATSSIRAPPVSAAAPSSSYPRTPPHDSPIPGAPPTAPSTASNLIPSSPPALPTPSAPSPDATSTTSSKPAKQKRKRNAVAGPSRQSSAEARDADGHPPHWMGADNTLIRCICGLTEDDGFTVLCERCNAWEHALCFGYRDESRLPDVFLCELCHPRPLPFSAEQARALQLQARASYEARRGTERPPPEETETKKRSKSKRPRTAESVKEPPPDAPEESRDSPSSMGPPPSTKPKRSRPPGKPRSTAASLKDGTEDEEYFRILPWELEYTPLKDNLIRGRASRQAMTQLYHEWVDGEEEAPRKQRPAYHDSGLPSPTETGLRLSPDTLSSPPDFAILAPPVPPVFLSGPSLSALEAATTIRSIEESASMCYLPLKYIEPSSGIYPRPTLYGVFALDPITMGGLVGEFRGEIVDSATYRQDAVNQYSALGVPKPYCRSVGPPVNIILDARSYGSEMRFIRNGCHPNAVLRPIFFRGDDATTPKLRFGVFASRDISKNEEIVLAWEWDDQHVVHTLRTVIDSTLKNMPTPPIPAATMEILTTKFDSILTNIFGTFQSCACTVTTDCAFSQMRRLVNGQVFHGVSGQRARKRIDLGELLGAVRGWRKRELEEAAAAKARRYRSSGEWEVWRAGPDKDDSDVAEQDPEEPEPSRPPSEAEPEVEEPVAEPVEEEAELVEEAAVEAKPEQIETTEPEQAEPEPVVEAADPDETDDEMTPALLATASLPAQVTPPAADLPDDAAPPTEAMDVDEPAVPVARPTEEPAAEPKEEAKVEIDDVKTKPPLAENVPPADDGDIEMAEKPEPAEPVTPVSAAHPPVPPSSVLSSIPHDDHADGSEALSGNESDATTITIARSNASNSDADSDGEVDVRPAPIRRGRRVLSPSGDSSSLGSVTPSEKELSPPPNRRRPAPMPPTSTPPRPAKDRKRRARKNVIASSDESSADESTAPAPNPKRRPTATPSKRNKKRKSMTDESESEKENVVRPRKVERKEEREKVEKGKTDKAKADAQSSKPLSSRSDKTDRSDKPESARSDKSDKKSKAAKERKEKEERKERELEEKRERERVKEKEREKEREEEERLAKEKEEREEREKVERAKELEKERAEKERLKVEREKKAAEDKAKAEAEKVKADKAKVDKVKAKPNADKPKNDDNTDKSDKVAIPDESKPASKSSDTPSGKAISQPESESRTHDPTPEKDISDGTPEPKPVEKSDPKPAEKEAPKEPPPPPPKKVSMREYLATHKIRKHTAPEASTPVDPAPTKEKEVKEDKPTAAAPAEPEPKPVLSVSTTPANNARLNLLEHLPSSRTASTPTATTTPLTSSARPLTTSTPSSSYVPRVSDHLPTPSSSYAPRPSPSYVPRSVEEPMNTPGGGPGARDDHTGPSMSPLASRAPLPVQTPPRPTYSLPDMPSALANREGPPHHSNPGYGPRAPPTGPRIPPTGPRGNWNQGPQGGGPTHTGPGPVSPVAPLRPSYPPRGGFGRGGFGDRGGGWRGRGFRGRGRGM